MTRANMKARLLAEKAIMRQDGVYEMSQKQFDKVIAWAQESSENFKIMKKRDVENTYNLRSKDGKTLFATVEVVNKSVKSEKTKKVSRETLNVDTHGHKAKGNNYIVIYKNKDDKKETTNTEMTTCAEIKAFLKTVSKKQLEYLKIYDSNKNEVRKSAWVV